jgi:TonB family protein
VSKEDSVPVPNPDDHLSRLLIEPGGLYGYNKRAGLWSLVLHVSVVALAFALATTPVARTAFRKAVILVAPDIAPYTSKAAHPGGGGDRSLLPASKGRLPRFASRQFTPPAAVVNNPDPKLMMEPKLVLPLDANVPNVNMAQYGDPLAPVGPASNGQGPGGGIGNAGCCGGVGDGVGPGYGPGRERAGPPVYQPGGSVTRPVVLYQVEPDYSDEARRAKLQGIVTIYFEVNERGLPQNLRIFRPLGMGLDEKAIEAVLKWRFRPGLKDGRPVTVSSQVIITFRLL